MVHSGKWPNPGLLTPDLSPFSLCLPWADYDECWFGGRSLEMCESWGKRCGLRRGEGVIESLKEFPK